jgi:SAM-dependent methyltransferase
MYEDLAEIYERAGFTRFSHEMAPRLAALLARFGKPRGRVCDLACGTGDAAIYLAQRGYALVGIDVSARMLAEAQAKGRAAGVEIQWLQADARDFLTGRPMDAVTCIYDGLNYMLSREELAAVFAGVSRCLVRGGLFLFDMNTRAGLAEEWGTSERIEEPADDLLVTWQTSYDHETDVNTLVLNAFVRQPGGAYRRIREVHRERAYPVAEIRGLLEEAGFQILALGDLELQPLRSESERLLCVAQRA